MQKLFFLSGLFLFIQVLWGHKMPIIIGPASVLLIGIVSSLSSSYSVIYTSIALGGLLLSIIATSNLLTKINLLFTNRIIVVILLLIGITLSPVILNLIFENSVGSENFNLWFSIILVFLMLVMNKFFVGIWKSVVILIGIALGVIANHWLGKPLISTLPTSTTGVAFSSEFSFFIFPLKWDFGVLVSFVFCYIALLINELGSLKSIGSMLDVKDIESRIKRGVLITGLSNIFSGMSGVIGMVNFSFSPGIISSTKCASRFVLVPAAVGLILISLSPELVNILNKTPPLVIGSIMFYLMVSQLAAGFQLIGKHTVIADFETAVTVAFPLMLAILISFLPKNIVESIPTIVRPILSNGFVMGILAVVSCEHLIFKNKNRKA